MIFTFEGKEYQIIQQIGTHVQMTKAFRIEDNNFIEVITVDDFKNLGEIVSQRIALHIHDLKTLMAILEQKEMLV